MNYLQAGFAPYFSQDFLHSHWQLTQRCNFACPYCVNAHERTAGIHMDPHIMRTGLRLMAALNRPRYHFSLSGGEVTLYPHLEEMLAAIAAGFPAATTVTMLSNGSASVEKMRRLLELAPGGRFIITLHPGQIDPARVADKLLAFSADERKKWFHLKLVAPPRDEEARKARATLDAAGIRNYSVHAVVDFSTGVIAQGYSEEDDELLAPSLGRKEYFQYTHRTEEGERTVSFLEGLKEDMFRYQGMFCSAGRQSIYLDEYGRVSRGQFCGRMPYTILEKNPFDDPDFVNPARCAEARCACTPFTSLPKWRDARHAPFWLTPPA